MKIIDLLNKIANGEDTPMFKYEGKVYEYNKCNECFDELYNDEGCKSEIYFCELNDEIEIFTPTANNLREYIGLPRIEEKKIPEKLEIEQDTTNSNYYIRNEYGTKCYLTKHSKIIADKVNQVIDYLNSKGE